MFEQMVKEAYEEVEVYRNKLNGRKLEWKNFDKDFSELPLLEKNDILGHEGDMIPPRYIMDFYNEELLDTHTSGSTGKCLEVYWRAEDAKSQCIHYGFIEENITELNRGIKNASFIQLVKMKTRMKTESVM